MNEKLSFLNSLTGAELQHHKKEWKKALEKFPNYKLAKQELDLINKIMRSRYMY